MSSPNLHQSTTLADLARLVEGVKVKSPELYSRAISGATLVLTGAVSPDPESGPNVYRVNGSKAEPYAVDLAGDCACEDYQRRGISSRLTEHATEHMLRCGMDIAVVETGGDPGHAPARAAYEAAGFTLLPIARYFRLLG